MAYFCIIKFMKDFKPILIFILKFVIAWGVLVISYNFYLSKYHSQNKPDPYSQQVASWTATSMNAMGFQTQTMDDSNRPWTWILMDGQRISYINEGCNAISIMLIFVAFIVAFSTTWKQTILYILGGLILIQIMNVFRIVVINYIFKYHHEYGEMAHDYLFPAILYGTIVLLWIIWVKYFALKRPIRKSDEQMA